MPPKTEGTIGLNNYLQSVGRLTSLSWTDSQAGPQSAPIWTVVCKIDGKEMGTGTGAQKYVARDNAANAALAKLRGG